MTVYDDAQTQLQAAAASVNNLSKTIEAGLPSLAPMQDSVDAALGNLVDAQHELDQIRLMPLVSGLFVEGANSPVPQVVNTICNVHWSDLQKTSKGPLVHPNPIDTWLAKKKPGHVRLFFGRYSPTFAFAHGSVTMSDPQDGVSEKVPYWWNSALKDEQADVIDKLAAEYDGLISLIFMATPMSLYAEPMMRGTQPGRDAAAKAGLTEALDCECFYDMMEMFAVFTKTRLGLAFNPKQVITGGQDVKFTNNFMDEFRIRFDQQAHVQNNSVRVPMLSGDYPVMYSHMKGLKPSGYQLATEPRVGDYAKAIQWCVDQGAHSVELSPNFQKHLTAAQLTAFDALLKENA